MPTPPPTPIPMPEVARRLAQEIPDGTYVNLGIGLPNLVQQFIPEGRDVVLHSENGILGLGGPPPDGVGDRDLVDAGKARTTMVPGSALFDSVASFGLIRGGHVDLAVLGAYQVSAGGDLANWSLGEDTLPSVGGAMDLAASGSTICVLMPLFTRTRACKIVQECDYPLTAVGCVSRAYTDHGSFVFQDGRVWLVQSYCGLDAPAFSALTGLDVGSYAAAPDAALVTGSRS